MRLTFLLLLFSTSLFGQEMMLWSNAAVAGDFSPTDISGLKLWLDGADTDGDGALNEETGAAPTTWIDKSGNGYNFTRIGDPQIVDAAENGNDVIAFDGSDGYSRDASGFEFLVEDDYTAFFVLEANDYQSASTIVDRVFTVDGSDGAKVAIYFTSTNSQDIRWGARNFNNQEILDLGFQTDNEYTDGVLSMTMFETNYGSSSASGKGTVTINGILNNVDWVDNGANNTPNTGSFLNSIVYIGYGTGGSYPFHGEFAEIILFSKQLSSSEISNVEDYLVNKWFGYPSGYVFCNNVITEVSDVTSTTGKVWMDRNLGASRQATSSTDSEAYGDLFQWGRFADGHQCRSPLSSTTTTNATTAVPNAGNSWDGLFILESNSPYDWLTTQNDNLWQGVNGVNNPCPNGYRLPTNSEWDAERLSWSQNNSIGAYASALKLTVTGNRLYSDGNIYGTNSYASYYSSTVFGTNVGNLFIINNNASVGTSAYRARGFPLRCIKD